MLHHLNKFLNLLIVGCIAMGFIAHFQTEIRPDSTQIHESLHQAPTQTTTKKPQFEINYKDTIYVITPKYEYELFGLVASHNNIYSLADSYHNDKSVDIKDICVLWGKNLETNDFHQVDIKNGSWTCYFKYPAGVEFYKNAGSNNHLIASDLKVLETIKKINKNDQVHIKGYLVDYYPKNNPDFVRSTSISRDDLGNRACEVIYVKSIEILAEGNPEWYKVLDNIYIVLAVVVVLKIVFFFAEGRNYAKMNKESGRTYDF